MRCEFEIQELLVTFSFAYVEPRGFRRSKERSVEPRFHRLREKFELRVSPQARFLAHDSWRMYSERGKVAEKSRVTSPLMNSPFVPTRLIGIEEGGKELFERVPGARAKDLGRGEGSGELSVIGNLGITCNAISLDPQELMKKNVKTVSETVSWHDDPKRSKARKHEPNSDWFSLATISLDHDSIALKDPTQGRR